MLSMFLMMLCTVSNSYSVGYPEPGDVQQTFAGNRKSLTLAVNKQGRMAIIPFDYYLATHAPKPEKTALVMPSETIMGAGVKNADQLGAFLMQHNHQIGREDAYTLASLYMEESGHEGVNTDVAFTQMCLETGFLRFDGDVDKGQYNYCGLGVTGKGEKGLSFRDSREGVRAHIQHLKAYASTQELKNELVDKRFYFVKRGSAQGICDLTGKWASDKHYDKKIRSLLNRLGQTN
jgi:hypothetical protein